MATTHSTAADPRSHVRGNSIALPRKGSRVERSSTITGGTSPTFDRRSSAPRDALSVLDQRQKRKLAIKVALGLSVLLIILHFATHPLSTRNVENQAKERKVVLDGSGESFVLPKRWREGQVVLDPKDSLPDCKRVLLFVFSGSNEFASELNAYLRAYVIASKLGYTLLADDAAWQHGSLRDYFLPRLIYCRPPPNWFFKQAAVPLGSSRWANEDRVYLSHDIFSKADEWLREEILDPSAMEELKRHVSGQRILPEGETLPAELEEVFSDFAAAAKELFSRPNDQLATLIRSRRMELGLGEGGLRNRKHSPTWGGNRREGAADRRQPVEEVAEDDHDFDEAGGAQRSDRGPIIGLYIRAPDVGGPREGLGFGVSTQTYNLSATIDGAKDALARLSKSTVADPGYSRSRPLIFREGNEATLVLMSTDPSVMASLSGTPAVANSFRLQRASPPSMDTLRQWKDLLKLSDDGTQAASSAADAALSHLWTNRKTFNALPRGLRVLATRYLLGDLFTLALYADAFIISASTDLGRLACVLAGEDGVVGPRAISGHGLGGRVRSIDTPWFPTSKPENLFS